MVGLRTRWILAVLAVCAVFAALWGIAQSPDGARVADKTPFIESHTKGETRSANYPTEDAPLPVRVIPSAADAEHTAAREKESDEHERADLIAQQQQGRAAIVSAWIALGGTVVAGFALWFLIKTYGETKAAAEAAQRSANAAMDQVNAMQMADRPHLVIKDISIDLDFKKEELLYPSMVSEPRSIPISYKTANVGKSLALIVRYGYHGFIGAELPPVPQWSDRGTWPEPVIPSDDIQAMTFVVDKGEPVFLKFEDWLRIKKGASTNRLFFFGFVEYNDLHGKTHRTSGAWLYQRLPYTEPEEFFQPCGPAVYWQHT
jgi:hypothetical protein